jgi:hypothetical protein
LYNGGNSLEVWDRSTMASNHVLLMAYLSLKSYIKLVSLDINSLLADAIKRKSPGVKIQILLEWYPLSNFHFWALEENPTKIVPYGTSSASENFQDNQNLDSQNSRSVVLGGFSDLAFRESEFWLYWKLSEPELVP